VHGGDDRAAGICQGAGSFLQRRQFELGFQLRIEFEFLQLQFESLKRLRLKPFEQLGIKPLHQFREFERFGQLQYVLGFGLIVQIIE
jgi:hypothetical protein